MRLACCIAVLIAESKFSAVSERFSSQAMLFLTLQVMLLLQGFKQCFLYDLCKPTLMQDPATCILKSPMVSKACLLHHLLAWWFTFFPEDVDLLKNGQNCNFGCVFDCVSLLHANRSSPHASHCCHQTCSSLADQLLRFLSALQAAIEPGLIMRASQSEARSV